MRTALSGLLANIHIELIENWNFTMELWNNELRGFLGHLNIYDGNYNLPWKLKFQIKSHS